MNKRYKIALIVICAGLFLYFNSRLTRAQAPEEGWSAPYRLSSEGVELSEGYIVADRFGYTHFFWVETHDTSFIIFYVRFDGEIWSEPVDIFMAPLSVQSIGNLAPVIDKQGFLHLAWTQGNSGPIFYSSAPANDALSAQKWSKPIQIQVPAFKVGLQVDSKGILHIVYSNFYGREPGMYYMRSEDQGQTWSFPVWLDPDIPLKHAPHAFDFTLDERGGLHLVWSYMDVEAVLNTWVRYAHSFDGGLTWSDPFTIDEADETEDEVRMPVPSVTAQGDTIHVIWAGTSRTNREHRYSVDRGETWGETARIFGALHGQAAGDGTAVDALGRLHFASHIRHPRAIWHAYWDGESWAYLAPINVPIATNPHYVRLAITSDNKLIMTFRTTSDADAPLYAMVRDLDDISFVSTLPTPFPTPVPAPQSELEVTAVATTPLPESLIIDAKLPSESPGLGQAIGFASVLSLILLSLVIGIWALHKRWRII